MDIIISRHGGGEAGRSNGVQLRRKMKREHCQVVFVRAPFWPGKIQFEGWRVQR